MKLKSGQQRFFACLIAVGVGLLALAPFLGAANLPHVTIAKLIGSSGLFFDIAGIIQLELSGAFDTVINKYSDVEKYPYGPPSPITRQIIDNPDTPVWNSVQRQLFFEHRTGIGLLITGFVLQLSAVWIWV
jgi:hypothetical protein